jgi:hypothetical protein
MNPILLKTLIQLAASNKKPAPAGTVGTDAHLKNRIVLFADEAVNLPDWGISGLPSMILGAAPQTCLFVSDLDVSDDAKDADDSDADASGKDDDEKPAGSVSFSLTIKAPPAPDSPLHARTIVWKLTLPIEGFRDVQTGASSTPVHAPVIKTRIKLGGLEREVEIGLLEMGGLDQPLLIGKDTLSNKFLIRPDRPEDQKAPTAPSVDLTPAPAKTPTPEAQKTETDADQKAPATVPTDQDVKADAATKPAADDATKPTTPETPVTQSPADAEADTKAADKSEPDQDGKPAPDETETPAPEQDKASQDTPAKTADDAAKPDDANQDQTNTPAQDTDKAENTPKPDEQTKPEEAAQTPAEPTASNADASETHSADGEKSPA